jgi:DNA sulfur modification protein DndB
MANQTIIPALRAKVGDWDYYICSMKYGVVDSQVKFAFELGGNKDLNSMIQRGLGIRTKEITDYLLRSEHRFLGALIVACWGGAPKYLQVRMEDPEGIVANLDEGFGVLTFDGSQRFFALDGQHRLRAIKDALGEDLSLANEEICVLIVNHFETPEGKERTRRLFTNINRNAKTTSSAENIALDEDDGYAILTRRLLTDHEWLSREGVVKVFNKSPNSETGEFALAGDAVSPTDPRTFTTISVLYKMLKDLGVDHGTRMNLAVRPTDDELEQAYVILSGRLDDLFSACGGIRERFEKVSSAREVRAPKNNVGEGHPFARPVIQRAVARVTAQLIDQGRLDWGVILGRLRALDWRLGQAPWLAVFSPEQGKMLPGSAFQDLLDSLLYAHLGPGTGQLIKDARKAYRDVRGSNYPVAEQVLRENLPTGTAETSEVATPASHL